MTVAAIHNRLIDFAIIADLRGEPTAARAFRLSARMLVPLIGARP